MSVYKVTGIFNYRGHAPGTIFIASLQQLEEERALERGNIEILHRGPVALDPLKIRRPKG